MFASQTLSWSLEFVNHNKFWARHYPTFQNIFFYWKHNKEWAPVLDFINIRKWSFCLECVLEFSAKLAYSDEEKPRNQTDWKLLTRVENQTRPLKCKFMKLVRQIYLKFAFFFFFFFFWFGFTPCKAEQPL